jgi:beta-lactam-binding protein with PASTA domain
MGPQGGQVIDQTPEPGKPAVFGTGVSVVLGSPPADLTAVPQLIGDSYSKAIRDLSANNLRPGNITGDLKGLVQSQGTPAGTQVRVDTPVNLQMSAPAVTVPPLLGLDRSAALQALAAVGLITGNISGLRDGVVISQSPEAGEQKPSGSEVAITLGSAAPPSITVPDLTNLSLSAATSELGKIGLRLGHESGSASGQVLSQIPAASTQVTPHSTVDVTLTQEVLAVVPDLTGLSDQAAAAKVLSAQLQVGPILGNTPTNESSSALVVTQSPAAGSHVPVDTVVSFAVSVAPRGWPWAAGGGFVGLLGASAIFYLRWIRPEAADGATSNPVITPVAAQVTVRGLSAKHRITFSQSPRVQHEMTFRTNRGTSSCVIRQQPQITSSERQRKSL